MVGNTSSSVVMASQVMQQQSDMIWTLWIVVACLVVVAVVLLVLWLVNRAKKNQLVVGVHMLDGAIRSWRVPAGKDRIRIDHGKLPNGETDWFTYLNDPSTHQRVKPTKAKRNQEEIGKIADYELLPREKNNKGYWFIQFYYHNPNPIRFDAMNPANVPTVKEQNLDNLLSNDLIAKLVNSRALLNTIIPLLFAILIIAAIGTVTGGYVGFMKENTCSLTGDNRTIAVIDYATHIRPMQAATVQRVNNPRGG